MRVAPLAVAIALSFAFGGCLNAVSSKLQPATTGAAASALTDLASNAKSAVDGADGTRTFEWDDKGPGGVSYVLGVKEIGDRAPAAKFQVDQRVGFVEVNLSYKPGGAMLQAFLMDDKGRVQCGTAVANADGTLQDCTVPVPANTTLRTEWSLAVGAGYNGGAPGQEYKLLATLHPRSHLERGDPLAGVDQSIAFDAVTAAPKGGSESNIGVLPNGHVVAQFNLNTLISSDDGRTWKDASPKQVTTLDPMMYVDPWTKTIYVDQLYVGCSQLSWSSDEGASWLTNPAACGLPSDDHQKVITGPNPIPGAPCPAVYYSWTEISVPVSALFVARSLDCGVNFITAKVTDTTERAWDNDMLAADRLGNVYVPFYGCDHGGYIGVGVSNDYGATWTVKTVDKENEPCYDADPGFAVDSNNTAYVVYHRPSGVKYAYSLDHGKAWSEPALVSPPSLKSFVHVDGVGGDPGKIAIMYRATPDTDKGPDRADGYSAWNVYVTFVENATSAKPAIRTGIVNDPSDPTQRGPVCTQGIACAGGSRNLLDFVDIAVGPDGRVYVVYADGCDKVCETPSDSRARLGIVGVEEGGPKLFADGAPWAKGGGKSQDPILAAVLG